MKFDILVNFIFLKNEKYKFSFFIFQYHDDTKRTRIGYHRKLKRFKVSKPKASQLPVQNFKNLISRKYNFAESLFTVNV